MNPAGRESAAAAADLLPLPDPKRIERLYAPQLESCHALLDAAWENRPNGIKPGIGYRLVLLTLFGRGVSTFRAVLGLCREGAPVQALMLGRSLYEDMIATYWATLPENRDDVSERVIAQERHWDELYERKAVEFTGDEPIEPLMEEEWLELNQRFGAPGKNWFGRIGDARKKVMGSFGPDEASEARTVEFLTEIVDRVANATLHSTVKGLLHHTGRPIHYDGRVFLDYGQTRDVSEEDMRFAFYAGEACFSRIAVAVLKEFEIDPLQVVAADEAAHNAIFDQLPSARSKLGPNTPCWCGSGMKKKKCHEI